MEQGIMGGIPVFAVVGAAILLLYVLGMIRAYRAAGSGWSRMDRDVKAVYLLVVPLFLAGVRLMLWADKVLYRPAESSSKGPGSPVGILTS